MQCESSWHSARVEQKAKFGSAQLETRRELHMSLGMERVRRYAMHMLRYRGRGLDIWVVWKAEIWQQADSKQKGQGPNLPIVKTEGTDAKISGNNVYRIIPVLRADTNKALASLRPKNPIDVGTCKMQGSLSALETIRDNQPNRSPRTTRNFVLLANKSCGNRSRLLLRRNAISTTREKQ